MDCRRNRSTPDFRIVGSRIFRLPRLEGIQQVLQAGQQPLDRLSYQATVAGLTNKSPPTILKWGNGAQSPELSALATLAAALNVPEQFLLHPISHGLGHLVLQWNVLTIDYLRQPELELERQENLFAAAFLMS